MVASVRSKKNRTEPRTQWALWSISVGVGIRMVARSHYNIMTRGGVVGRYYSRPGEGIGVQKLLLANQNY